MARQSPDGPDQLFLECVLCENSENLLESTVFLRTEAKMYRHQYGKRLQPREYDTLWEIKQAAATRFINVIASAARRRGSPNQSSESRYTDICQLAREHQESHVYVRHCTLVIAPYGTLSTIDQLPLEPIEQPSAHTSRRSGANHLAVPPLTYNQGRNAPSGSSASSSRSGGRPRSVPETWDNYQ